MRFLLLDRVTSLEPGRRIVGTSTFSLSDDLLAHHFPREPVVPAVLLLEAMAQLLGWGIAQAHDFQHIPVLSLLEGVEIARPRMRPGFVAAVTAEIVSTSAKDSLGRAFVTVSGERVVSAERMIYKHFQADDPEAMRQLFIYLRGEGAAGAGGLL